MKSAPIAATLFALLTAATSPVFAAEADWKVGLASIKVTPETPVQMAGYAGRIKPFERVEQDIYAKALVLEDAAGQRAVIVTMDLIGMRTWFADPLVEQITARTGLKREQMLFTWAHNHAGPALSAKVIPTPGVGATDVQNQVAYTRWLQAQLVELVVNANARLEPARLSHGVGVAKFVMNRREFTPDRGIILGVNPRGLADRSVPVLRIDAADGKPRAVLFGTAAHNTTLGAKNLVLCGDYAGFAQHYLQEQFPGVQAMFMLGCAGDTNPYPRDSLDVTKQHGRELATEVARVLGTKLRPVAGPLKVAFGTADLPLRPMTKEQLKPLVAKNVSWQVGNARRMLNMLEAGEKLPTHHTIPLAVWQFGRDLTLVAISGETVGDYVPLTEKALGPLNLWIAGYTNDGFGYLPSARIVHEGGYETRGLSSGEGWFAPEAQDAVIAKIKELAAQVGRLPGPDRASQ